MSDTARRAKIAAQSARQSQSSEDRRAKRKRIDQLQAEMEYGVALRYEDLERAISWGSTRT